MSTIIQPLRDRLRRRPPDASMDLALGGAVGVLTGLLAYALIQILGLVQSIAFGTHVGPVSTVAVPVVGAFLVGVLVTIWSDEPSGGGIGRVLRNLALRAGKFRARVPLAVLVESGLALGTGGSGGREAPMVLGGGAMGSAVGRFFGLDEDRVRALVAGGAAAGIGASFNAPIGGILFALELILGRFHGRSLQVVVLASVAGSLTARGFVGADIAFQPHRIYALHDWWELIGYAIVGILAVGIGLAFLHGERWGHEMFGRLRLWPPLRFALGGLAVGLIALAVPEVLGTGHLLPPILGEREPVQTMLDGGFGQGWPAVRVLLLLLVAKLVASLVSVTSGNAVGSLMPTLFTGAALGGAVAHAITAIPSLSLAPDPGAYALVGMAAVFAAAARTPLTAILIVVEMTGDYGLVVPLMLTVGLATVLADRMAPNGIYTAPLVQDGIVVDQPDVMDLLQTINVGEVLTAAPPTMSASLRLPQAREAFRETGRHGFAVMDDHDRLLGVVTLSDLDRAQGQLQADGAVVADIATRDPIVATEDTPIFRAVQRMAAANVGRLPVVDPQDPRRLVAMLRRQDIIRAYSRAVHNRAGHQLRREQKQLNELPGIEFREYRVTDNSAAAGRAVRDVPWPQGIVLASVRRNGNVLVPNGATVLQPDDHVVVFAPPVTRSAVEDLLVQER